MAVLGQAAVEADRARADDYYLAEGTGVAENVVIREQPSNCELTDDPEQPCLVHQVISIREAKDRAMDLVLWAASVQDTARLSASARGNLHTILRGLT